MNFTRKDFNCAKDYREALEHYTRKLENLVDCHIKAYDAAFNKIVQQQEENNSLKNQVRELQESITRYISTIDSLSEELNRLRGRISGCEDENYHLRIKIEELKINQRKR